MEEKIEYEVASVPIKCDYCGFEDKESNWANTKEVLDKWENKKCPKCGKIMLTKEQADKIRALMSTVEFANLKK